MAQFLREEKTLPTLEGGSNLHSETKL